MSNYTTNEIRGGMKLLIDGDPYAVIENEYVKPGKGQAFNRIRVRNLRTGRTVEKSYRSGESIEAADVMDTEMQYLYKDGDFWTFMNPDNYEQMQAGESAVGEAAKWLKDGTVCIITLWNGVPLLVTPPPHIELKVIETDPGVRGDTATGGSKPAKMETGAMVRVPLFINEGEVLRIDTRSGEYISPSDSTKARARRSSPRASAALKRAGFGLSRSSTPSSSVPRSKGITTSEFDAESQAM